MCESPLYEIKRRSRLGSSRKGSLGDYCENLVTKDPFLPLVKNNSQGLMPLSPKVKLPKLMVAMPPRPSLPSKGKLIGSPCEKFQGKDGEEKANCVTPSEGKISHCVPKGKRIKIKGTHSNVEVREAKGLTKRRNNIVILDIENDVTFGMVGKVVTKNNIN